MRQSFEVTVAMIGNADLLVAATAQVHRAALLTHNAADFRHVCLGGVATLEERRGWCRWWL
ncbi:MAG: hypothetical protein R2736_20420 [Solirubrobacterales bacterium]